MSQDEILLYVLLVTAVALLAMWYLAGRKLRGKKVAG
jgi:hypothetical protein